MDYVYLFVISLVVTISIAQDDCEEVCCAPRFTDSMKGCPNFKNDVLNGDALQLGIGKEGSEGGLRISGRLNLITDLDDGCEVELAVYKITDMGKEYVYGALTSLCDSLKSKKAPWSPVTRSLNITSCPITKGNYLFTDVAMNLDFAKDAMAYEFCGFYEIEVLLLKGLKKMSCHVVSLEIYEIDS